MKKKPVRPIDISYTAPELPTPLVSRPHFVNAIKQVFETSANVVCVEGTQGLGKTVLLREFVETVESPCFSVFLTSSNRLSYDPVVARVDFANQVNWFLYSKHLDDRQEPTDGDLRTLWTKCAQRISRLGQVCYVIVDGLHHIPSEHRSIAQAIWDPLPLGLRPYRFLISGDIERDFKVHHPASHAKSFQISAFGSHETDEYLKDIVEDKELRTKYHSELGGVPLLLASLRRQVSKIGAQSVELSPILTADADLYLQAEWRLAGDLSELTKQAMATILAYGFPVDTEVIARLCSTSVEGINSTLRQVPFAHFSEKSKRWSFVSEAHSRYAQKRLDGPVKEATERIVEILLDDPDSDRSLKDLPLYLERLGKTERLLDWLSEDRLASILHRTQSTARIEPTLRKAIGISADSKNDLALTTYSIVKSAMQQVSNTTGIDQEIRARGALGDYEGALSVANNVPLLSQRLRLLAVLARSLSQIPGGDSQRLMEQIAELMQQVNIGELPSEEAIDIAVDLYPVDPNLALKVLKQITQSEIEDVSFETAVARISLAALYANHSGNSNDFETLGRRIGSNLLVDKKLGQLFENMRTVHRAKSAEDVLESTSAQEDAGERLFIQRKWITQHPSRVDGIDVVESALDDAITASQFAPNASFYREISTALPYCSDAQRRQKAVAIIDGQQPIILSKGPTVEYARLQLHLAHCNFIDGDLSRARHRLEDAYLDTVESISELGTRLTCLAWFAAELQRFDPDRRLAEYSTVQELVIEQLENTLESIVGDCANQFEIVSGALDALALYLPERAISIARRLNTVDRRVQATAHIVFAICRSNLVSPNAPLLLRLLADLEGGEALDSAIAESVSRICRDVSETTRPPEDLTLFETELNRCTSQGVKAECLGSMVVALANAPNSTLSSQRFSEKLLLEFEHVGNPIEKHRIACQLVAKLRASCPELASRILDYISDPSHDSASSENVVDGMFYLLDLITKAVSGLAQSDRLHPGDVRQVCQLVDSVREPAIKVLLLSRLAFFLWRAKESKSFENVINAHLWPAIARIPVHDVSLLHEAWTSAYYVVWLEDRDRARNAVKLFPVDVKNACISVLCLALLRGQPSDEPYEGSFWDTKFSLDFLSIRNLLHLCRETDEDSAIFGIFQSIADAMTAKGLRKFPNDQKAEVSCTMIEIAQERLPVKRKIQHLGYQILCECQALRIFATRELAWETLIESGKALKNAADRAYVLTHISSYLPAKLKKKRDQLLQLVESEVDALPSIEDQYDRYCAISSLAPKKDKQLASRALQKALSSVAPSDDQRVISRQNHIVNMAYRLDEELPMKLATVYDEDPAREEYRLRAQKQLRTHQLRKDIGDFQSDIDLKSLGNDPNLASAAWRALAALNSGRMIAADINRLRGMLACASNYPLAKAYPMYSWVLSNVMIKYSSSKEGARYMRDIFDGLLRGARFFLSLSDPKAQFLRITAWNSPSQNPTQIVIESGERDAALEFLSDWLKTHAREDVTIMDPYFHPADLELLRLILKVDPTLRVKIITGKTDKQDPDGSLSAAYSEAWRELCDHTPPETEFLIVWSVHKKTAPFHDRWMLSGEAGVSLGTSFNSLGERDSHISVLTSEEVTNVRRLVEKYQTQRVKELNGERVTYASFELLTNQNL